MPMAADDRISDDRAGILMAHLSKEERRRVRRASWPGAPRPTDPRLGALAGVGARQKYHGLRFQIGLWTLLTAFAVTRLWGESPMPGRWALLDISLAVLAPPFLVFSVVLLVRYRRNPPPPMTADDAAALRALADELAARPGHRPIRELGPGGAAALMAGLGVLIIGISSLIAGAWPDANVLVFSIGPIAVMTLTMYWAVRRLQRHR